MIYLKDQGTSCDGPEMTLNVGKGGAVQIVTSLGGAEKVVGTYEEGSYKFVSDLNTKVWFNPKPKEGYISKRTTAIVTVKEGLVYDQNFYFTVDTSGKTNDVFEDIVQAGKVARAELEKRLSNFLKSQGF